MWRGGIKSEWRDGKRLWYTCTVKDGWDTCVVLGWGTHPYMSLNEIRFKIFMLHCVRRSMPTCPSLFNKT